MSGIRNGIRRIVISDQTLRLYGTQKNNAFLPGIKRIILIRHGQSLGNIDERAYVETADWRIPLTSKGREEARLAGKKVDALLHLDANGNKMKEKGKVYFYVSPYLRTRQSLREILREVGKESIVGIREDPRM